MKLSQLRTPAAVSTMLGVAVLALIIAIVDQHIGTSNCSAEILRQRQVLAGLTKDVAADQGVSRDFGKLSRQLGRRYKEVSWGKQMPFVVNQLTGILQARKLNVDTLRPDPITADDAVSRLPLRLSFKAGIGDLAHVIRDIEKSNPLLYIEQLDVRVAGRRSDLLQANMIVSSFAITDPNAPKIEEVIPKEAASTPAPKKPKTPTKTTKPDAGKAGKYSKLARGI